MDAAGKGDSNSRTASRRGSNREERSTLSIAEESIQRDLQDGVIESIDGADTPNALSRTSSGDPGTGTHSLAAKHRRPSYTLGAPRSFLAVQPEAEYVLPAEADRKAAIEEERSLLRDNNLLPGPFRRSSNEPTETTALLNASDAEAGLDNEGTPEAIDKIWEDAVLSGQIETTWQREAKVLLSSATRLIGTFILQQSLTFTSIFTAGHLGKEQLAAVSLGGMTAIITGYSVYYGLATSLDTLCAQAYGSGNKKLVGLNLQRNVFFLWTCTIPIAIVWSFSPQILKRLVPEQDIAELAGQYLRVLIFGAPGFACYESSKRYFQAQGRFNAAVYVLLIASPLNVLLQYIFVWRLKMGFIGSPTSVAIVQNLMPLLMLLYVHVIGGKECWPGFSRKAFKNWGPMISLALPGFIMLFAEVIAFEVITLSSAQFSGTHLAANTILQNLSVLMFSLPFPLSIGGATRIANLVGASLPEAAKITAKVQFVGGAIVGTFNMVVLWTLRFYIPRIYTNDPEVIALAAATLPVNAAFQLFDALAAQCNGVLRGLGKQKIGGYISLVTFYALALPVSFGAGFGLDWKLIGLWCGPLVGLTTQALSEGIYICKLSWQKASDEAARRNAAG